MSPQQPATTTRPRQVTVSGFLTLFGSAFALLGVFQGVSQLYSASMSDFLRDLIRQQELATYDVTLDAARRIVKYLLMATGMSAAAALVLGWFVLRRNRSSRIALTVMGTFTVLLSLLGGPQLWFASLYVGSAIALLWSKPAREWFKPAAGAAGPGVPPPAGGSDVGDHPEPHPWGPPPEHGSGPPQGPGPGPPPPPPPAPRPRR